MAYIGRASGRAALVTADIPTDSINSDHYVDVSIDTAHIADNQVTLAKMAGGTDGQIITYDASGDPVAVGPGSDGEVLTSTGAGSPPAFEALPAGGIGQTTQFQLTANHTADGTLTAWSGVSNLDGAGAIGTLVSESSGTFTLPLGVWLITSMFASYHISGDNAMNIVLQTGGGTPLCEGFSYYVGSPNSAYCYSINYVVQSDGTDTFKFVLSSCGTGSFIYGTGGWTSGISATQCAFIKLSGSASSA